MRDLLQFIRFLLVGNPALSQLPDPVLLGLFIAAGASRVSVVAPHARAGATYPKIVLEGEEGQQEEKTGDGQAKFFRAKVRMEIVTRQSDVCPDALDTLWGLQSRLLDLLLGNAALSLPGVQGQRVSPAWQVSSFSQCNPTRTMAGSDPTIQRHLATYDVLLNRAIGNEAWASDGTPVPPPPASAFSLLQAQVASLESQYKDLTMSYARTQQQLAHIQEVYFDGNSGPGHVAVGPVNTVPVPAPNSGIDTILVFIQPSATTQTVKLPTAAALAAANASGVCAVRVKNLGTMAFAGVAPGNGTDTLDGTAATYAPNDNTLMPGGVNTFETVGTTGFSIS